MTMTFEVITGNDDHYRICYSHGPYDYAAARERHREGLPIDFHGVMPTAVGPMWINMEKWENAAMTQMAPTKSAQGWLNLIIPRTDNNPFRNEL